MGRMVAALLVAVCVLCARARADVWDEGPGNDNAAESTVNELFHGADQVHDLAGQNGNTVADVDWFRLQVPFNSSFEVVVDELAGGVGGPEVGPIVELGEVTPTGTSFLPATPVTGFGSARRIAFSNAKPESTGEKAFFVRVRGADCRATCTTSSRYRIRMMDTTLRVARFNTTGGQSTVLVLQNPTNEIYSFGMYAFNTSGAHVGTVITSLLPRRVMALDLGGITNQAGGLQILSDAPYGALSGKAVQMDPATGFVFETAANYRAR